MKYVLAAILPTVKAVVDDLRRGLARAVRQLRQERGWTQEDLADAADVQPTYISDLERGARSPGLSVQQRLAQALGVKVWQLFRLAEGD